MEKISGYIEHIIFSNRDNGYTVFTLTTDTEETVCVGDLHAVSEGESVELSGEYVNHPMYGRQFSFSRYEIRAAKDEADILRYLSSGAVKGIGPSLAKRIVDAFGSDTFRIMEEEPEMLSVIKGISARKAQEIGAYVLERQDLRKVMVFLGRFGISNALANRIYKKYGNDIYSVMESDPYRLAAEMEGVGFKTADEIAMAAGFSKESEFRIRSGITYVLSSAVSEGHVYLPKDMLISRAASILEVDEEYAESECSNLCVEKKLVIRIEGEEERVYLPAYYRMEMQCARMLLDLDVVLDADRVRIAQAVEALEEPGSRLDDMQKEALVSAASGGVCVITGGPGTGKTTIINVLIKYLRQKGEEIVLAAPTGRAAKRMTEATGYESSTIQRLLGLTPGGPEGRGWSYEYNEDNPLEVDTVIIDEMSMVDLPLFSALLRAIIPGTRLVMVGDTDQLPSVGPGSVLKDIIMSGCFVTTRLDKIFRQDDASDITVNAHKVNAGQMPALDNKSRDFFMLKRDDTLLIQKSIVVLVGEKLPKYVQARPFDIQVLTPMRKGPLGVESLNPLLQKYLNPPSSAKEEIEHGGVIFREGDKIMQIKNNYRIEWEVCGLYGIVTDKGLGVFNGDMGIIDRIDRYSETVEVVFDENHRVRYSFSDLDELELSYAVTVHKSQGSEYPAVVLPLLTGPRQLFNRNILYTAITRARKCVTIVGSRDTVRQMVDNAEEVKRYTGLDTMIEEMAAIDGRG